MIGQQRVIACKCTHPTPNSDVTNASDAHPHRQPPLRFRSPKPKLDAPTTQNPRPTSHEKSVTQPRRIRDPRLTHNITSCSLKSKR
jgi:hypothetical protein